MGRGSLGKRVDPDPSASISLPVTIRRAKSSKKWGADDPAKRLALSSLSRTWDAFEKDVHQSLCDLREPALRSIASAALAKPPHGDLVAVCVLMGTAAIAGDRTQIFDSVLSHLTGAHEFSVVRLRHAGQKTVSQIDDVLRERIGDGGGSVVLALDDVDCAPPEAVRDIVYLCSALVREHKTDGADTPPISLVLGLSTSADPLHAALGVQESAAVSTVVVSMPRAEDCISHLVENVLSRQVYGVVVHRRVWEMIEKEYFERDSTLAMILRTFKQIYTLHFMQQALACVLAVPKDGASSLALEAKWTGAKKGMSKRISKSVLDHLRTATASAQNTDEEMGTDAQLTKAAVQWATEIQRVRYTRHTVENLAWHLLRSTAAFQAGLEDRLGCKRSMMRANLYKAFLPNGSAELKMEPALRVIREELMRAQKHQLVKYVKVMVEMLERHSIPDDERITGLISRLTAAEAALQDDAPDDKNPSNASADKPEPTFRARGSAAALGRRRAQLLGASSKRTPLQQKLATARKSVIEIWENLLSLIPPIESLPMHESVYYSRVSDILKISGGIGGPAEPRHTVLSAMRDPAKFLGSLEEGQVPDTAVSYQIMSEGGKLVNIYDWYNSFSAVRTAGVRPDEGSDEVVGMDANPEVLLQAKFAKACSELEFLGLVKHTKRKTDHVQRLVFE